MYGRADSVRMLCRAGNACRNRIPVVLLERMLEEVITHNLKRRDWGEAYVAAGREHLASGRVRLTQLKAEQDAAKTVIQKAFHMVMEGRMPENRYQVVCEPLEARLATLQAELFNLERVVTLLEAHPLDKAGVEVGARQVAERWTGMSVTDKRAWLESNQLEIKVEQASQVTFSLLFHPQFQTLTNEQRTVVGSLPFCRVHFNSPIHHGLWGQPAIEVLGLPKLLLPKEPRILKRGVMPEYRGQE
jgi:hypothetical protein